MITIKGDNTNKGREPLIPSLRESDMFFRASSLDRLLACPGSYWAEKPLADTSSEPADSGTLCHLALQLAVNKITLNNYDLLIEATDVQVMSLNLNNRESFIVRYFADIIFGIGQDHGGVKRMINKEQYIELELPNGKIGAHPDLCFECMDGTFHIGDNKTGRLSVDTAERNIQLQTYLLMIAKEYNLDRIYAHIFAAGNEGAATHTSSVYHQRHFGAIYATLIDITSVAANKNACRMPGESQCRYCKSLMTELCPESRIHIERTKRKLASIIKDEDAMFAHADTEELDDLIDGAKLCQMAGKKVEQAAKLLLKSNPERSEAYTLGKPRKRRLWKDGEPPLEDIVKGKLLTKKKLKELGEAQLSVGDIENAVYAIEKDKADSKGERPRKKIDCIHGVTDALKGSIVEKVDAAPLARRK